MSYLMKPLTTLLCTASDDKDEDVKVFVNHQVHNEFYNILSAVTKMINR